MSFDIAHFTDFANDLKIVSKERGLITLGDSLLGTQRRFLREVQIGLSEGVHEFVTLKARQIGLCHDPSMRVLTADLRWVAIRDLRLGDELVSVDENFPSARRSRRMRTARVEAIRSVHKKAYRLRMANGVELIATAEHRYLMRQRGGAQPKWKPVSYMRPGDVLRYVTTPWDADQTYEDGWMGGLIDGEGHLRLKATNGSGVGISQVAGDVLERARAYLSSNGYHFGEHLDKRDPGDSSKFGTKVVHKFVVQRMNEMFRLLGITRPSRFVNVRWWEDLELPGKRSGESYSEIESIEPLDEREMVDIQTSTKTFICEGFVSHNSTICMAFDLYWPSQYEGTFGAIVTHDDGARESFRAQLDMYYEGLPEEWQVALVQNNRSQLVLGNGSMLRYLVAGTKEKGATNLGRSAALVYLHATEVAFWGSGSQMQAIKASLAEENPLRFYNWETTANGFNHFYDMWCDAKKAVSQRAIFISWWANELYQKKRDSQEFRVYWGHKGRPSPEERDWIKQVKELYGVEITAEQMAWYRWTRAEKITDEMELMQAHPPTEDHAFVATGSKFFVGQHVSDAYKRITAEPGPKSYRIHFGPEFTDTRLVECTDRMATLRVWEEPQPKAFYVLGADPAYGASDTSDNYNVEVYRAYANRLEQVAEFSMVDLSTYAFAWVVVYLAGCYEPSIFNLEMNGPGEAVLREIQNLKKLATNALTRERSKTMYDVVGKIKAYYYRRLDSIGGMPSAIHTLTTERTKDVMMNLYKDYFERGILVPHSRKLIDEMKSVVREEGRAPAGSGGAKDDRVIGSGLACIAWNDQLRTRLIAQNVIWLPPEQRPAVEDDRGEPVVTRAVKNYLETIGVRRGLITQQTGTRTSRPRGRG